MLTPMERELLEGMCNCYSACGENFENTVRMVAHARGLTVADVKEILAMLAKDHGNDKDYMTLRSRLPAAFPF